jgi:hypothetical protein
LYDIVLWHAIGATLLCFILYLLIAVIQMQHPMYHKICSTVTWTLIKAFCWCQVTCPTVIRQSWCHYFDDNAAPWDVSAGAFCHTNLDNQKEFVLHRHLVPHKFYCCWWHRLGNIKQSKMIGDTRRSVYWTIIKSNRWYLTSECSLSHQMVFKQ